MSWTVSSDERLAGAPLHVRLHRRARRLRLRIDPRHGGLTLTVPPGVSRRRAIEWAHSHAAWAREALGRSGERIALCDGVSFPFRGEPVSIAWQADAPRRVALRDGLLTVGGPVETVEARVLRWLRSEALRLLSDDTAHYAALAGVAVTRIGVGDPTSHWGSCSSTGAIRFSWRLVMVPDHVRRATAAHEVAHRVHMDHGPAFHALVAELYGADPAPARAWLRREGAALHRIGSAR